MDSSAIRSQEFTAVSNFDGADQESEFNEQTPEFSKM